MFRYHLLALLIGTILDFFIGDPHDFPHPIRLIGSWISTLEEILLGNEIVFVPVEERKSRGFELVAFVLLPTIFIMVLITIISYSLSPFWGVLVESIISCYCLACRSLYTESKQVVDSYLSDGIIKARESLSMIVGRDTKELDLEGVLKATIETIAENASDGFIAPLFYLFLGGPILGMTYKAINTMDSMVGYRNERYEEFGYYPAKLDDIANFVPSRLCGLLVIFAARICPTDFNYKNAKYIFNRDRLNHKSPNSAQSEAAFAGALGIQLGGGASYFGQFISKPTIGDAEKEIEIYDVHRAHHLLFYLLLISQIIILIFIIIF